MRCCITQLCGNNRGQGFSVARISNKMASIYSAIPRINEVNDTIEDNLITANVLTVTKSNTGVQNGMPVPDKATKKTSSPCCHSPKCSRGRRKKEESCWRCSSRCDQDWWSATLASSNEQLHTIQEYFCMPHVLLAFHAYSLKEIKTLIDIGL